MDAIDRQPVAIAILGPTASGKTALAEALAERLRCRIVNADVFQMYRGLDIGTAKPARREPYDLLDVLEPTETFSAGKFVRMATERSADAYEHGNHVIVCGGTGLYVRALFEGYPLSPPPTAEERRQLRERLSQVGIERFAEEYQVDLNAMTESDRRNPVRLVRAAERQLVATARHHRLQERQWHTKRFKFGYLPTREWLLPRIRARVEQMLATGWEEEVERLLESGIPESAPAFRAIGYREVAALARGDLDQREAFERIVTQTWQYAKRQLTWLRKEPNLVPLPVGADLSNHVETVCGYIP